MKTSLFFLFLIFFTGGYCNPSPGSREEKIWKEYNEKRRNYAKEHNIANMWKLEWSEELVGKVHSSATYCDELKSGPNFRLASNGNPFGKKKRRDVNQKQRRASENMDEVVWPGQKMVGCTQRQCSPRPGVHTGGPFYSWRIPPNVRTIPLILSGFCLAGPLGIDDKNKIENGEAGSKCEAEGGKNEDGLCVPADPIVETSTSNSSASSIALFSFPLFLFIYLFDLISFQ
ncbi:hypothetical protein CRE_13020 [Caenorhabditis remanei]|uniref:Uncharacterized protein n=1 Tax=Caenorhabditis remanei TaxID=31234 RepID=E3N7C1_CAERE|nr:hypothetical protein CRE_13020 [Caenorhabditis remanei]